MFSVLMSSPLKYFCGYVGPSVDGAPFGPYPTIAEGKISGPEHGGVEQTLGALTLSRVLSSVLAPDMPCGAYNNNQEDIFLTSTYNEVDTVSSFGAEAAIDSSSEW
jgi:hypothetical protein